MGTPQDGPAGVLDPAEGEVFETLFREVFQGSQGDGLVIGVDEWQRAVVMIPENIDDGNAFLDQLVGAKTTGLVVDAGNDAVDVSVGGQGADMGGPGNTPVESPVSSVVVDVPPVNLPDEFGDAAEHVPPRRDRGFDFEKNPPPMTFFGVLHGWEPKKSGGNC
jgi:hypothetical protein